MNRLTFRDPCSDRFPPMSRFLVAAFPCLAPCRDPRAFHFGVTSDRPSTTSGSSCGEEDGSAASSRQDCWRQTPGRVTVQLPQARYYPVPDSIGAVRLLPCPES